MTTRLADTGAARCPLVCPGSPAIVMFCQVATVHWSTGDLATTLLTSIDHLQHTGAAGAGLVSQLIIRSQRQCSPLSDNEFKCLLQSKYDPAPLTVTLCMLITA